MRHCWFTNALNPKVGYVYMSVLCHGLGTRYQLDDVPEKEV